MLEHFVSRAATELTYKKRRLSYTKGVTTEQFWNFELGVQSGIDFPIYVTIGFMQRYQFNQEHRKKRHNF